MEFLKFVRSVEEFLYELMTWLLFYPRTLWLALRHPVRLAAEAQAEMNREDAQRFAALISPPLFLMLSVLVAWLVESALHLGAALVAKDGGLAQQILASPTDLLVYRVVSFSIFPLAMALGGLWQQAQAIDRQTLRQPFYLQCYMAGPFALALSFAADLLRLGATIAAAAVCAAALAWFIAVETAWFRRQLGAGRLRALALACGLFACAFVIVVAFAFVLLGPVIAAR
jgi:hypothetical protein